VSVDDMLATLKRSAYEKVRWLGNVLLMSFLLFFNWYLVLKDDYNMNPNFIPHIMASHTQWYNKVKWDRISSTLYYHKYPFQDCFVKGNRWHLYWPFMCLRVHTHTHTHT